MTADDTAALEALSRRLEHVAATAQIVSVYASLDPTEVDAVRGIAETLRELRDRLEGRIGIIIGRGEA